jgi:hypothetical protein
LFVEEAQSMPIDTLEEIRLLSNLETDQNKLLQMVLFGQPELDEKLSSPHIRQLKERITHSFNLSPFPQEDTLQYLNFRLRAVGYKGPDVFNKKTAGTIKKYSDGLTRRINIIADKALLAAFSEDSHTVTTSHIKSAALDSEFKKASIGKNAWLQMMAVIVVMLALFTAYFAGTQHADNQATGETLQTAIDSKAPSLPDATLISTARPDQSAVMISNRDIASGADTVRTKPIPDGIADRLAKTWQWLAQTDSNHYSIQLFMATSSDADKVEAFLQHVPETLDFNRIYIYETVISGRKWYSVLYEDFATQDDAIDTLAILPTSLKASDPYLRRVSALKKDVMKANEGIR